MGTVTLRHWDSREYASRPARPDDRRSEVFESFIPHPISGWLPDLNARTWQLVSAATQRCLNLGRVDSSLPAEWLLQRAESIASSSIEGIRPSARRVARGEARLVLFGEQPPDDEMQALRNVEATTRARRLAVEDQAMSISDLCGLQATLMGDDPIAGQIRTRQNWVGGGLFDGPTRAHHVGPPPEVVPALLDDLMAFINAPSDGIAMVRAALAHAQFETIHPFADGNGRTGRALLQYMYRREGLCDSTALPISAALMLAKSDYFAALDSTRLVCDPDAPVRSRTYGPWIELLAMATEHGCQLHERLNTHVNALQHKWGVEAGRHRIRGSSAAARLLKHLPTNPIVTASHARRLLGVTERTARNAVARLADAGILVQRSAGPRNKVYECTDMMDAFAEAARDQPAGNLNLLSAPDRQEEKTAVRSSLVREAARIQARRAPAAEVAALEADEHDRGEMRRVASTLRQLRAPIIDPTASRPG